MSASDEPYISSSGTKFWYKSGVLSDIHRVGAPAIIYADGEERWVVNNRLHREDGPATIAPSGEKFWFIQSKRIRNSAEYQKLTMHSDEYMAALIMKYGPIK